MSEIFKILQRVGDGKKEVGKHKAFNYRYSKKYVLATALQCYVHFLR